MSTPAARAAYDERDIEVLRALVEIGLDLAAEVATLSKRRIAEARESGWDGNIPADPGAAFNRLAQSVRRCIALKARLLEGPPSGGPAGPPGGDLFACDGGPIGLDCDLAIRATPEPTADRLAREAREDGDRRETLAADLGPMTDPRERLFEVPFGSVDGHVLAICQSYGLDPARLRHREDGYHVAADAAESDPASEIPLAAWRGDAAALLAFPPGPVDRAAASPVRAAAPAPDESALE